MSLDRHHYQLLAAIADHGQLGAAARSLHLSPSAASHRIREAERRLGVTILERNGRVAKLSPAGRLLAAAAQSTERQLIEAEQSSRWLTGPASVERVRVGVGPLDTSDWYRQLFADPSDVGLYSLDLISIENGAEDAALRDDEIDLALAASSNQPGSTDGSGTVLQHPLQKDRLVAVVPNGFRLPEGDELFAPRHARGHDYLAVSFDPLPGWELDLFLDPIESEPRSLRHVDRVSMLLTMVEHGLGISIQPMAVLTAALHHRRLQAIELSVDLPVHWYAATRSDAPKSILELIQRLSR